MNEKQYIVTDGSETKYYSDREMTVLHREDGPAAEYANGDKEWYLNGELHREDGPAIEYTNGDKEWFINDKRLTEAELNVRMSPIELTLEEIAAKFGVSVSKLKIKK